MKTTIKYILHSLLGFRNYLYSFSLFKIYTLRWDKKENDFLYFLNQIPENTTVLDIGANIGIMTAHLARKIKNVQVFSFEPMPANIEALKRIIDHFELKNVIIMPYALGNTEGELEMVMPVVNSVKMQGLSHVVHESITENNEGVRYKCPVHVLDTIPELKKCGKISGIKIDVENFEYFVLEGGKELINHHHPIVYAELWDNENRTNCFNLMKGLGYSVFVLIDDKLELFDPGKHHKQNFIMTHSK